MDLEQLFSVIIPYTIHILEAMGVFVIIFAALKAFLQYAKRLFNFADDNVKIELAKALALGLEFKLGGEILRTLMVRTLDEMLVLGSIILLRVILTFVIHWEIESDTKHASQQLSQEQ